ncbi:MAG TPA: phytanoyl-CoA dioxygenase family protein [Thermoanaerobaculia bacterium]|nr:phytanoyl-CoA dioxygenase family protein [Thermoanaerobaculia bacterium]
MKLSDSARPPDRDLAPPATAGTGAAAIDGVPWIERPGYRDTPRYRALPSRTRALCDAFHDDGYLVIERSGILDGVDLRELNRFVETHMAPGEGRIIDGWVRSPEVLKIAIHPAILDLLRTLYGREPIPFQTLNFLQGTEQQTHSDSIHFSCLPARFMCGVWVALEDILLEQGPLHYFPGSHRLPELDYNDLEIDPLESGPAGWVNPRALDRYRSYERKIGAVAASHGKRRELAVRKGGVLIWSSNLLHGGSLIGERGSTRRSQVTHFFFEDCVWITPMFSNAKEGRFAVRTPFDMARGRVARITWNGRPVVFHAAGDRMTFEPAPPLPFDAERAGEYLRRYPDVALDAVFNSVNGAWNHYVMYGHREGRTWG